jgi:IS5 family transposase
LREILMATDDFFRSRLDQMIDLRHPLAVLAGRLPWARIEAALAPTFARKDRLGKAIAGSDLFGTTLEIAGAGVSAVGRPRLPIPADGIAALAQTCLQPQ